LVQIRPSRAAIAAHNPIEDLSLVRVGGAKRSTDGLDQYSELRSGA